LARLHHGLARSRLLQHPRSRSPVLTIAQIAYFTSD
jgi:hypothetical protein